MKKKTLPFFEGIEVAVHGVKPLLMSSSLRGDAEILSDWYIRRDNYQDDFAVEVQPSLIVGRAWAECLCKKSYCDLRHVVLPVIHDLPQRISQERVITRGAWVRNCWQSLEDKEFGEMFTGAQVVLGECDPGLNDSMLEDDWRLMTANYKDAVEVYLQNGVSLMAARILIVMEYVSLRISYDYASFPNKLVSLIFGEQRYGWLEVFTSPLLAKIWVDEDDWGESPAEYGVGAGLHHVRAELSDRKAEETVRVEAGCSKTINLRLN